LSITNPHLRKNVRGEAKKDTQKGESVSSNSLKDRAKSTRETNSP